MRRFWKRWRASCGGVAYFVDVGHTKMAPAETFQKVTSVIDANQTVDFLSSRYPIKLVK